MDVKINWFLYNNNKLLIARKLQDATFDAKNVLIYEKDDEYHKIDLINKVFIRKTKELKVNVNFNKNICSFDFDEIGEAKTNIVGKIKYKKNKIKIEYKIDTDIIKIIVEIL